MRVRRERHKLRMPRAIGRSVGLHISEVIRSYALATGTLDKKYKKQDVEEDDTTLMQVGLALELYLDLTGQHPHVCIHPGEVYIDCEFCKCGCDRNCHQGYKYECNNCGQEQCSRFKAVRIFMSPDGLSFTADYNQLPEWFRCNPLHILHEFKFTKKSSREFEEILKLQGKKARMWLWQIMSYLKAMGTLAAKLHVCFVNGNYSYDDSDPDSQTLYDIFWLEFTQEEIDDNWDLMSTHAQRMVIDGF